MEGWPPGKGGVSACPMEGTVGQRGPGVRRTPAHTGCLWSLSAQHATTPHPGDFNCVHLGSHAGKSVGNH